MAYKIDGDLYVGNTGKQLKDLSKLDTVGDSLPIGSVFEFEGDTVPDGYVQVEHDFAQVHTYGVSTISTDGEVVTGYTNNGLIESGKFTYDSTHHGIKIPAGSCRIIQPFGVICGSGYSWSKFQLYDANDTVAVDGHEYGILVQFGGNGYWCVSMPSTLMVIPDITKDYYLKLRVSGYNGQSFHINNGYGTSTTTMGVVKIK